MNIFGNLFLSNIVFCIQIRIMTIKFGLVDEISNLEKLEQHNKHSVSAVFPSLLNRYFYLSTRI